MSFNDLSFYPFAAVLLLLIFLAEHLTGPKTAPVIKKLLLLAASFYVICLYRPEFCLCTAGVIGLTYAGGRFIERCPEPRKPLAAGLLVTCLVLLLGYFKYFNFLLGTFSAVTGRQVTLLQIAAPVGISFYIFTAISYLMDVSWGKCPAETSLINVALLIAYFPKLLCGPLVRGNDFLPQLRQSRRMTRESFAVGIQIFVFGFFKKAVLANHMARFLDSVFFAPSAFDNGTLFLAMIANMPALYFDFSGYSDMAIGMSRMIGYKLQPNFNLPFITSNISEFWNRWHMTLTAWLQTYLFNPLAVHFRRKMAGMPKKFRKKHKLLPESAAAVITFLISGIWHGVGFNFAIFGLLHGIFYVIQKLFAQARKKSGAPSWGKAGRVISILANFLLINLIQVFFRTGTVREAAGFYRALFVPHAGVSFMSFWCIAGFVLLGAATLMAILRQHREGLPEPEGFYPVQDLGTVRGLALLLMCAGLALLLGYFGDTFFVYEQF